MHEILSCDNSNKGYWAVLLFSCCTNGSPGLLILWMKSYSLTIRNNESCWASWVLSCGTVLIMLYKVALTVKSTVECSRSTVSKVWPNTWKLWALFFCDAVSKSNRLHNLVSSEHFQPENSKYCSMATPWCEISARVLISFIHMEFITPFVTSPVPWGYVLWFNFILGLNFTPLF